MAELFQTTPQNITIHLRPIYAESEPAPTATRKPYLQVRREGARVRERGRGSYFRPGEEQSASLDARGGAIPLAGHQVPRSPRARILPSRAEAQQISLELGRVADASRTRAAIIL